MHACVCVCEAMMIYSCCNRISEPHCLSCMFAIVYYRHCLVVSVVTRCILIAYFGIWLRFLKLLS